MINAHNCIFEDRWTDIFKDTHYFFLCPAIALLQLEGHNFDKDAAEKEYGPVVNGCVEIVVHEDGYKTISGALVCKVSGSVYGDEIYQDVNWTDLIEGVDTEDDAIYNLIEMAEREIMMDIKFWGNTEE